MEEALQKRIKIKGKKEVYYEEVEGGHLCHGRAYFLNLRSFYCLRAHSLYAGFLTTSKSMKKTKDNLITKLALREVSSRY